MAGNALIQEAMLQAVSDALGPKLASQMAFVGGCTTALLITDPVTREGVRATQDVDLIVHLMGYGQWNALLNELRPRGFRESMHDDVSCRLRLRHAVFKDLIVDFMPDDAAILGFTNRWYTEALAAATDVPLTTGAVIRVVSPPYFVGTKLEAYNGRGNNDPIASRDIEDILNVVDGRETLRAEIQAASAELRGDIAQQFTQFLKLPDFAYCVQSTARGNTDREEIIFQRWEAIANLKQD